jgi:hypothetical protein
MRRPMRRADWLALSLILLLAAGLRLTRLGLIEFKYDEATTARTALAIAREGRLPALGMVSSQGPRNPALMSYLLAPPFALSRDPRWAAGWLALWGVAAVGLTYWLGRAYFGRGVAVLAALLFAASPWAVLHSRKIWAQNVPLVTLLFIAALLAWVVRQRRWALTAAWAAAAALVGLHLGGLAFVAILGVVTLLFIRRVRPLPLAAGLGLALLFLGPYLLYDARHGWPNLHAFAAMRTLPATLDLQAASMAGLAAGGYRLESLAGARYAEFRAALPPLQWLDVLQIVLMWIALAWMAWRVAREALRRRGRLTAGGSARLVLLCWFGLPVLLLLRHSVAIFPHTLSLLYPVQHLAVAVLVADGAACSRARWGRRPARAVFGVGLALALLIAGWQAVALESLLTFVDRHDTPGGYGAPVKDTLALVRRAQVLSEEVGGAEIIAVLAGADPRTDGAAAVFDVLLGPQGRLADGRAALVFPAGAAVYLVEPGLPTAAEFLLAQAHEAQPPLPARTGSADQYRFYVYGPLDAPPAAEAAGTATRWAAGVRLLHTGWTGRPEPGGSLRWILNLRVEALPPPGSDFHWFNHLLDAAGEKRGQLDGPGFPATSWRLGDRLVLWFDIPISADAPLPPYTIRSGMYAYPEIVNVPLLDEAGNPAGEFIEVGPVGGPDPAGG